MPEHPPCRQGGRSGMEGIHLAGFSLRRPIAAGWVVLMVALYVSTDSRAGTISTFYRIDPLGSVPSFPSAINESTKIVGSTNSGGGSSRGFFVGPRDEELSKIVPLIDGLKNNAADVNDQGVIVGTSDTIVDGRTVDRLYTTIDGIEVIDGGVPEGALSSYGSSINNGGQIVGYSRNIFGQSRAFLTSLDDPGVFVPIPSLGGANNAALDINNDGSTVGWSQTGGNRYHGFISREAGTVIDLGTLPGGTFSSAVAINDRGQVVGYSGTASEVVLAVRADPLTYELEILPTLAGAHSSFATDINLEGLVVGYAVIHGSMERGFLYDESRGVIDLNDLITTDSGWIIQRAQAVNDRGQIVGTGIFQGVSRGFVMTPDASIPVPEPAGFFLIATGLLGIVVSWIRRVDFSPS